MCPIRCHTHQHVDWEVVLLHGSQKIELADEVEGCLEVIMGVGDFFVPLQC